MGPAAICAACCGDDQAHRRCRRRALPRSERGSYGAGWHGIAQHVAEDEQQHLPVERERIAACTSSGQTQTGSPGQGSVRWPAAAAGAARPSRSSARPPQTFITRRRGGSGNALRRASQSAALAAPAAAVRPPAPSRATRALRSACAVAAPAAAVAGKLVSSHRIHGASVAGFARALSCNTGARLASAEVPLAACGSKSSSTRSRSALVSRQQVGGAEHHAGTLAGVGAFGHRQQGHVQVVAEIEARRTDEIADVLDEQDVERRQVQAVQRAVHP